MIAALSNRIPSKFNIDDFTFLHDRIISATYKINGNTLLDEAASDSIKGDDWNPVDSLNLYLEYVAGALNTNYQNQNLLDAKSKVRIALIGLVEAVKIHKPYLTEKYDSVLNPGLYDVNKIADLIPYVIHARKRIEGNTSLDSRLGPDRFSDGTWTPLDQLNLYSGTLTNIFKANYMNPALVQVQTKLREEYNSLIQSALLNKPHLVESLSKVFASENKNTSLNKTNLNNLA